MSKHPELGQKIAAAIQEPAAGGRQAGRCEANFNFEEWALLAKVNPEAFELRRREIIDMFLRESPERQRRFGGILQREIDAERQRAGDPQKAFLAVAKMMCQQLAFLGEELHNLSGAMKKLPRGKALGARSLPAR